MRRKRLKAELSQKSKLSFLGDDEEENSEDPAATDAPGAAPKPVLSREPSADTPKLGKDPTVATEFLPDKDREAVRCDMVLLRFLSSSSTSTA